jgi:hypothetical protein
MAERQAVGLHLGADPRAKVGEGLRQPGQVLPGRFWRDIDMPLWLLGSGLAR